MREVVRIVSISLYWACRWRYLLERALACGRVGGSGCSGCLHAGYLPCCLAWRITLTTVPGVCWSRIQPPLLIAVLPLALECVYFEKYIVHVVGTAQLHSLGRAITVGPLLVSEAEVVGTCETDRALNRPLSHVVVAVSYQMPCVV
jgi:hypothetical protein